MTDIIPLASSLIALRELCSKNAYRARKKYKDNLFLNLFPGVGTKDMICPNPEFLNTPPDKFKEYLAESGLVKYPGFVNKYNKLFDEMIEARSNFNRTYIKLIVDEK